VKSINRRERKEIAKNAKKKQKLIISKMVALLKDGIKRIVNKI